ncbi:MAG: Crp/Fnr family transcriptional regulator [Chloroflexi bacterium]|nr:Crp/Fnr family transcriptional regulator [Chloroflexota bacterium]
MAVTQETIVDMTTLPLLQQAREDTRAAFAACSRLRHYRAGQLVQIEGDHCEYVHLVAKGLLRLRHFSPEGREHVVGYLGPGRLLNLAPALDGGTALATVDALTDVTTYVIPCTVLNEWLDRDAGLSAAIARYLARDLRRLDEMLEEMALHSVRSRLARFLLNHAETNPTHHRWTQAMIAANIGTVRDVVGRLLREMREEGIIRRERGRLVIVDREALEREANAE